MTFHPNSRNSKTSANTILFDSSKNEIFQLSDNYKTIHRKLKSNRKLEVNSKEIDKDTLKSNVLIFVLAAPQSQFTENECKHIKEFIDKGGKLMILMGEGGEQEFNTNVNFLLEDYGMSINNDSTVRTQYYKYFHPKECMIGGGVVCESMWQALLEQNISTIPFEFTDEKSKIQFLYPYGATLNVAQPSNILMTTGAVVYPFNRPISGYFCNEKNGKILMIGSGHMFHDKYIVEETNMAIWDYIVKLMTEDDVKFSSYDFGSIDINDNRMVPDTIFLAEQAKMCLLESLDCDIPADFKKMFNMRLHSINNDLLPNVIELYKQLNVQYESLKIIKPQFEIPLPPLQLAVFQKIFSDLQPPALELFDLDEAFSSDRAQLTQLTNKCMAIAKESKMLPDEKELEYFIKECGRILGVHQDGHQMTSKDILYGMCIKIAKHKKLDGE